MSALSAGLCLAAVFHVRHPLGWLLIALGLSLALILLILRWIRTPVAQITLAAQRIAGGQWQEKAVVNDDEFADLARAFNEVTSKASLALAELRAENEGISGILKGMVEQVIAVNAEGKILYLNPAAEEIFDVKSSQAVGKSFLEIIRQPGVSGLISLALKHGAEVSEDIRLFLPEEKFFEAKAIPLKAEPRDRGVLLVLHDITRVHKLEEVRKDFVANVSHELRTPLTSIQGYAETLLEGALSDRENNRDFVQTIHEQAERLSGLVNDLLDLSAIESGGKQPKCAFFSLGGLTKEVEESMRPAARKHDVHLDFRMPEGFPEIFADRDQVKQVLINLADNAIKFNRKDGSVVVRAASNDLGITIEVKDTGSGIPESDLGRVFERFYRVGKGRSRNMGGTGLGLAIVKHILESHQGTVRVESILGEGSTFFVFFPNLKR